MATLAGKKQGGKAPGGLETPKVSNNFGRQNPPHAAKFEGGVRKPELTGGTLSPRKKARDKEDSSLDRLDWKKAFAAVKGRHGVNNASDAKAKVLVKDDSDDDDASSGRPRCKTRAAKGGRSADDPADRADDGCRPTKAPPKSGRGVPTNAVVGGRGVPVHAVSGRGVPAGSPRKNVRGGEPSFLFGLNRERAYAAANRAHGAWAETANDDNSTTTATATATMAEMRMKVVGGERQNPPQVPRVADGRSEKGMHGAAVATVDNDESYDNDGGVASVRHQDPPQAAQFKNEGHKWEGGRTPRKKAQGGEASPISRPDHERGHAVAGAGIDAMDEDDSGDEDDALGNDDDDDANDGADDTDGDAADNDADDIASVGRRTQRGRRSNPADRASGWRQATTPTKMLTERRRGATARTVDNDGPGGGKMTNDELASGGRGREPNHDRTAGTAVARTRTVLAGVRDFRQDPIALTTLAVLNTPRQATKACRLPERGPATAGTLTRRATPRTPRRGAACEGSVAESATPKQQPGHQPSGTTRRPPT